MSPNNQPLESRPTAAKRIPAWGYALGLFVLIAIGLLALYLIRPHFDTLKAYAENIIQWIDDLGFWGSLVFIVIYIIASVLFMPATIFTASAGTIFGLTKGIAYVSIGSTLGATVSFLIARYFARAWVEKKISKHPRFTAIDSAVAEKSWKIVGLTRLSPIIPFAITNYGYGITKVKIIPYIWSSWLGMMPATVLFVYIGSIGKEAVAAEGKSIAEWSFYAIGLLATIWVTIYITKASNAALQKELQSEATKTE